MKRLLIGALLMVGCGGGTENWDGTYELLILPPQDPADQMDTCDESCSPQLNLLPAIEVELDSGDATIRNLSCNTSVALMMDGTELPAFSSLGCGENYPVYVVPETALAFMHVTGEDDVERAVFTSNTVEAQVRIDPWGLCACTRRVQLTGVNPPLGI